MKLPELPPVDGNDKSEDDLLWHALNFRGAQAQDAELAYEELRGHFLTYAFVYGLAVKEACAKFIEDEYERQWVRPWREDLAAAIRGEVK